MAAYVFISILSGLSGAAYALLIHGSSVWTAIGGYLVGGWTGVLLMVGILIIMALRRGPRRPENA